MGVGGAEDEAAGGEINENDGGRVQTDVEAVLDSDEY